MAVEQPQDEISPVAPDQDQYVEGELTETSETAIAVLPVITAQAMAEYYDAMEQFVRNRMKAGTDYGAIPGTNGKLTLLKPGAEKLLKYFGLAVDFIDLERVIDPNFGGTGEPFFLFRKKAVVTRIKDGRFVRAASGSANSFEKKYRWRESKRICPKCGTANILFSKNEGEGWFCWRKPGGCGAKFAADDPEIINQQIGLIPNPDIYDTLNTIEKIAEKRALVGGAISACNASEYFDQDIDDPDLAKAVGVNTPSKSAQATPAVAKTGPIRPYTPAQVKAGIAQVVEKKAAARGLPATEKQRGLALALLNGCFADSATQQEDRYAVSEYIFGEGKASTKTYTAAEASAVIDWLKHPADGTPDGGFSGLPSFMGVKEAQAILRRVMLDRGQIDTFGDQPLVE